MFNYSFFFFNDTATTEIYTLSLHDALPIFGDGPDGGADLRPVHERVQTPEHEQRRHEHDQRSEEHTSELQSQSNLVCRLLLEKKNFGTLKLIALATYDVYVPMSHALPFVAG